MTDPNKRRDDREPQKVNKHNDGNQGSEEREIGVEKPRKAPDAPGSGTGADSERPR